MAKDEQSNGVKLAAFFAALLLITLPLSASAQISGIGTTPTDINAEDNVAKNDSFQPQSYADTELFCSSDEVNCWKFLYLCKKKWQCDSAIWCGIGYKYCDASAQTPYCKSSSLVCCPSGYPNYCYGNYCYGNCASDIYATYKFVCDNTEGKCQIENCINPGWPNKCNNGCWNNCQSDQYKSYKFVCDNPPRCEFDKCIHKDYPNKCGNDCWSNCPSGKTWKCKSDGTADCVQNCVDSDGDGYGSGCSKGSDCNDNNKDVNPGKSETCNGVDDNCDGKVDEGVKNACGGCGAVPSEKCGDNVDNNCDGQTDEGCCTDSKKPYYCQKTSSCWASKAQCDQVIACGNYWAACETPEGNVIKCVRDVPGCCNAGVPYFCPENGYCFSSDSYCDGRKVYNCAGKLGVCTTKSYIGACFGNVLRCCPPGETWWESDKGCHRSSEPQKCAVPDGTSANCDCDTDSECAKADPSRPYCGETYGKRESSGFHACLSSKPEYCGNGNCGAGENYNNCQTDCSQLAPKGKIDIEVRFSTEGLKDVPVFGAYVYLDGSKAGSTDITGKKSVDARYGWREVKVECPDSLFCGTSNILVDGSKYNLFRCPCSPPGDLDNDGLLDVDELLLGTDPSDSHSNLGVVSEQTPGDITSGCLAKIANVLIDWSNGKSKDDLIQAHSSVVNALNVTQVTSVSVEENPYVIASALSSAKLNAEIVTSTNVTFADAVKNADYIDGIATSGELLIIATDVETGTTAIIAATGRCLGVLVGILYGGGKAVVDDVKGLVIDLPVLIGKIVEGLLKAIWFLTVNIVTGNLKKIEGSIVGGLGGLIVDVTGLYQNSGEIVSSAVKSMVRDILERGRSVNIFRDDRAYNKAAYLDFQVGFFNGYIEGWILGQIGTFFVGIGEIKAAVTAIKAGKLTKLVGKALELPEKLAKFAKEFGSNNVERVVKLKYLDGIAKWSEAEQKGVIRLAKHNEDWLKGLSEAEAKVAAKHADDLTVAGKVSDAAFGDLTKTKLGQQTLKASDATIDLLAKQSKLVQKWGVKRADEVVTKGWFGIGDVERIKDLNKILNAMPENLIDDLSPEKAVKFLGDKKLVEAAEKLSKLCNSAGVISLDFGPAAVQTCLTLFTKVDDFEDAVKGAKAVATHIDNLDLIPNFVQNFPTKVEALVDLGKLSSVKDLKGVDKLAHDIAKVGGGHSHAARRAVILKETPDVKLLELGKGINVKIKYQGNEFVEKLDIDIFYERSVGGKKVRVIEEVKSKESGVIGASEEVQKDILKMTKALETGIADEAKIVTKGTFDIDVTRFIEQNGNKVQLVSGGIK